MSLARALVHTGGGEAELAIVVELVSTLAVVASDAREIRVAHSVVDPVNVNITPVSSITVVLTPSPNLYPTPTLFMISG